jgi:uncharacterized repeat protein (TIGR01451 family)
VTPGGSGALTGERNGGGGVNDYRDTDDGLAETITVTYRAVVLNGTNNNRGNQRNNLAVWQWEDDFGLQTVQDSADNVRIVEPTLIVFKEAVPLTGQAGDTITFTLGVRHVGVSNADAFNVVLTDVIPADMTYVPASDDYRWIVEDPAVRELGSLRDHHAFDDRPIVVLTWGVKYALGGLDVSGYHAFNLAVHTTAGLLLFGIIRRLIGRVNRRSSRPLPATGLAFAIALVWLIHPLQTQSVTYAIQRCESLMGMFLFLCLYGIVRASEARRAWPWQLLAVAACGLGMGCKEVMLTAPVVALLLDRAFLASTWRELFRRRGVLHASLWGVALALLVMNLSKLTQDGDVSAGFDCAVVTPVAYLRTQPAVILHYLRLAFWPRPLCLDYHWPVADSPLQVDPAAAAVIALLGASVVAFRYWPGIGLPGQGRCGRGEALLRMLPPPGPGLRAGPRRLGAHSPE